MTDRCLYLARWLRIQHDLDRTTGYFSTLRYLLIHR